MDGVLILAHGSKRPETEALMDSLIEKIKIKTGRDMLVPAYLQFSDQNLEKGVELLIKKGAKTICIVPMFIFDGVHVTQDIPNELEEIRMKHPGIEFKMGSHIGDDDKLADIVADRIFSLVH